MKQGVIIMETNNHLAIQSYKIQTYQDVLKILDNEPIANEVKSIEQTYYAIDVSQAMSNLKQIGGLLEVAYAGCKGFPCAEKVLCMLSDYQTLVNNSLLASSKFRGATLNALNKHKMAILSTKAGQIPSAINIISQCEEIAQTMAKESKKLSEDAQKLCTMSRNALKTAGQDEVHATQKQQEVKSQVIELEGEEASLSSKKESLHNQINEEKKREKELMRRADKAQQQSFTINIVSSVMEPFKKLVELGVQATSGFVPALQQAKAAKDLLDSITRIGHEKEDVNNELGRLQGQLAMKKMEVEHYQSEGASSQKILELKQDVVRIEAEINSKSESLKHKDKALEEIKKTLDEQVDTLQKQGDIVAQRRAELQKEERQVNADLAKSVKKLQHLGVQTNDLERAIASLEVTVKTLGKVKTVFENSRLYWEGVQAHCKGLANVEDLKMYAELDVKEFEMGIQQSALSWLTLGKISHQAILAMEKVKICVDDKVENLPSREKAGEIIQSATTALLQELNKQPIIEEVND